MPEPVLNIALDVGYAEDAAFAAGVCFAEWSDPAPVGIVTVELMGAGSYVPGSFYLRELPSLLAVLKRVTSPIGTVVVDGYVALDGDSRPGLGYHLWEHLHRSVPVIGVAKTRYVGTPDGCALLRGRSNRPLYVSSAGLELAEAKERIASMHGPHRMPTLLSLADRIARLRVHTGV